MSQALAIVEQNQSQAMSLKEIAYLGDVFVKSGYFEGVRDQAQAMVKIMAGAEIGLPPMVSMTGIYIVKGKIQLGADVLAKKVKSSGRYDYKVKTLTEQICEIEFFEQGKSIGVSPFTIEQAKKAGTQNIEKFARNMLFARALSNGVRWFCPDVTTMTAFVEGELVEDDEPQQPTDQLVQDQSPDVVREDVPAVIAAIKKAAKDCGIASSIPLTAELKTINIELKGPTLQVALESLTQEKRAAALEHLQNKALDAAQAKAAEAETAAEPVHEGEVI